MWNIEVTNGDLCWYQFWKFLLPNISIGPKNGTLVKVWKQWWKKKQKNMIGGSSQFDLYSTNSQVPQSGRTCASTGWSTYSGGYLIYISTSYLWDTAGITERQKSSFVFFPISRFLFVFHYGCDNITVFTWILCIRFLIQSGHVNKIAIIDNFARA